MKIKVSEATPRQLDWMVAYIMGHRVAENYGSYIRIYLPDPKQSGYTLAFCPSTDWALGGPIIERENICLWSEGYDWEAKIQIGSGWLAEWDEYPLIAAMRCYVSSKLGDEVEIPEELK